MAGRSSWRSFRQASEANALFMLVAGAVALNRYRETLD
jgi:hypothetical protein